MKTKSKTAADPKPIQTPIAASTVTPADATIPDSFNGATQADLEVRWEVLQNAMQASVPTSDPDRFKLNRLVEMEVDFNRDQNTSLDASDLREALAQFITLPTDRARRLLGGWSTEGLSVNRPAMFRAINGWAAYPMLTARVCNSLQESSWQFDDIPDDDGYPVKLSILVGTPKRDVLKALDNLRMDIDGNWDRLIGRSEGGVK